MAKALPSRNRAITIEVAYDTRVRDCNKTIDALQRCITTRQVSQADYVCLFDLIPIVEQIKKKITEKHERSGR